MMRAKIIGLRWAAAGFATLVLSAGLAAGQEAPSDRDEIIHVLNRVTFGPCPGDVDMVEKMGGLHAYIEQQLHPDEIDDSAVEQQLAGFDLLQMSSQQLMQMYQEERKKFLKKQQEAAAAAAAQGNTAGQGITPPAMPNAGPQGFTPPAMANAGPQGFTPPGSAAPGQAPQQGLQNLANQFRSVAVVSQLQQAKLLREIESKRQLQEVLVDFWGNHFNIDVKKNVDRVLKAADDRDVIRPHIWGSFHDLLEASAKSPAMLFYLDNAGNTVEHMVTVEEQERRATVLAALGVGNAGANAAAQNETFEPKKEGGINENYAREIMELHTLGVDGGYTQNDVQEVARCFTGWTIDRMTGEFMFRPRLHDNGAKVVLGHQIAAGGGIQDGETVLDILCSEPACAHFISKEMCERFVSDDPPPALVDRIATVFTGSGGDLRAVTEAILTSPEFLSPSTFGNKIKSPLEFAVSAVRASQSSIIPKQPPPFDKLVPTMEGSAVLGRTNASDRISRAKRQSLNWHVVELGEPLFACTPPTGYKEVSKYWVSPGALIERLNFALALTQQQLSDIRFDPQNILTGIDLDKPNEVLDRCVAVLLQNNITDATRNVLMKTALPAEGESQTVNPAKLIALIIGSPEFQRK